MKKVKAIFEFGSDGTYSVYMDDETLEYTVNGQGNTIQEARADFCAVYEDMRKFFAEKNMNFTEVEFEYEYDLVSFLKYYSQLFTLVGLSKLTGINKGQLSHYINGTSRPGARTVAKIQAGISRFAAELAEPHFV